MAKEPERKAYGEFGHVMLSDEELAKLQQKYPDQYLQYIEKVDGYVDSVGKKYKKYYSTIQNWIRRDSERAKPGVRSGNISRTPSYDLEKIKRDAHNNTKIKYKEGI